LNSTTSSNFHRLATTIVELRRADGGVRRHVPRLLDRAAVFQERGDAGRAKGVIAGLRRHVCGARRCPISLAFIRGNGSDAMPPTADSLDDTAVRVVKKPTDVRSWVSATLYSAPAGYR
jgi:hypothetical protein